MNTSHTIPQDALQTLLDRAAITQVVQDWGLHRDTGRWEELAAHFTADATMTTTWFAGSASEFVKRSREAFGGRAQGQHFIGTATIALAGNRAVAETRMQLLMRAPINGMLVDVTCYGRFHDLFLRHDNEWRIRQRVPVYEKDRLDFVDPGQSHPLDAALLASLPPGCRYLTYAQSLVGMQVTPNLPCPGNEALARLEMQGKAWLAGESL